MQFLIKVTMRDNDGVFWYSATRGLLTNEEWWLATMFDSRDGVNVAINLLKKRHPDWLLQRKTRQEAATPLEQM